MTGRAVLHSLRMGWWYGLWRLRPVGRAILARTGWAAWAVMLRNAWHWVIANAATLTIKGGMWAVFSWCPLPWCLAFDITLYATLAWAAVFQLLFVLATNGGAPGRLLMQYRICRAVFGWKLAWRFRSRWPMEWAIPANKTRTVQAEVGNTSEATVTIRPVFDAPKMSWWPEIEWPVVTWLVSPPPGRTFAQFDAVLDVLASNIANVVDISLDYDRSSSSVGRLSILFDDPLSMPILPVDHTTQPGPSRGPLADVIDLRPANRMEAR
ncbi:MAG: hypothetical protein AAGA65_30480 [Actinomycetota bacterium]